MGSVANKKRSTKKEGSTVVAEQKQQKITDQTRPDQNNSTTDNFLP